MPIGDAREREQTTACIGDSRVHICRYALAGGRAIGHSVRVNEHSSDLRPGERVRVVKDPRWNGPWPSEPLGVIDPAADAPIRVLDLAVISEVNVPDEHRGPMPEYLVRFDEPQLDGDGGGPYQSAVIWSKYLRRADT